MLVFLIFWHYFTHIRKPAQTAVEVSAIICMLLTWRIMQIDFQTVTEALCRLKIPLCYFATCLCCYMSMKITSLWSIYVFCHFFFDKVFHKFESQPTLSGKIVVSTKKNHDLILTKVVAGIGLFSLCWCVSTTRWYPIVF